MVIAVGTNNKVKIQAVTNACEKIFKKELVIQSVEVSSGVSDQPMSDQESIEGAINRAMAAMGKIQADFGIGLEGGVTEIGDQMFLTGWVAVVHKDGRKGLASSGRILLPQRVAEELKKGERELGQIIDEISGVVDVKHGLGTGGILTNGLTNRRTSFKNACIEAMARFISPQFFQKDEFRIDELQKIWDNS